MQQSWHLLFQVLISLLFLSPRIASGQELPLVLRDDFENNANKWPSKFEKGKITFQDGQYLIEETSTSGGWNFYIYPFIETGADLVLECRLKWLSGSKTDGFGLLWGLEDVKNSNVFLITASGDYQIISRYKDQRKDITGLIKSDVIKTGEQANTLKVVYRGQEVDFYINTVKVHTAAFMPLRGFGVGFEVNGRMKYAVDYLEFRQAQKERRLIKNYPENIVRENLGSSVNSQYTEIAPVISADGLTLYYNRKDHPQNTVNANRSDIWYSTQNKEGVWAPAQNIGRPLNNEGHNFVVSVSPDDNTLLLGNLYKSDGSTAGTGISISYRNKAGWTLPQEVKVADFYNDNLYNEYCLAPNNKVLLLCLQRKDTYGQKDIYVSFLQGDGSWSAPQNIGLPVNSIGNEVGPFLAADGMTMYYSTDGHKGYGRNDIFVTRRLDDSWLRWSAPENLGPAINTPNWDAYYTVPAQGDYAYMVSSQNSLGAEDIFRLKLPESARPQTVVLIKGRVLHSKTKAPLEAQVVYELLKNGAEVGLARANPVDGTYQIALPTGEIYGFLGQAEGFYPLSESIDTHPYQEYTILERDLYLTPIEKNEVIRLNNLFFDFAKFSLRDQSFPELNRLVAFLKKNPEVSIEIGGHTDNVGTEANNLSLSKNRAEAVRQYLLAQGIAPERVQAKGYGEMKPIADNNTDGGRQQNRRVEFKIL